MYPFMYRVAEMDLFEVWDMALLFWNWIVKVLSARIPDPTCCLRLVSVFSFVFDFLSVWMRSSMAFLASL